MSGTVAGLFTVTRNAVRCPQADNGGREGGRRMVPTVVFLFSGEEGKGRPEPLFCATKLRPQKCCFVGLALYSLAC